MLHYLSETYVNQRLWGEVARRRTLRDPHGWATQGLTIPICSERILVRLLWRPGARKQANEDLTAGRAVFPDCPFNCHCLRGFLGGSFLTRTFGKSERMLDALEREGTPHFGSACFKILIAVILYHRRRAYALTWGTHGLLCTCYWSIKERKQLFRPHAVRAPSRCEAPFPTFPLLCLLS